MSRRVIPTINRGKMVKGEVEAASCHVCKAHGKSEYCVNSHNFRDVKGRVCCPTMLENICSKCGVKGHFQSGCSGPKEVKSHKSSSTKEVERDTIKDKTKVFVNAFDALADEDDAPPANVTIRKPLSRAARLELNWADDSESDEE